MSNEIEILSKPWVWALGGIFLVGSFFHFFQSLIVFVGGTTLGLYMFRIYGPGDKNESIIHLLFQGTPVIDLLGTMKDITFWVKNLSTFLVPNTSDTKQETRENFWPVFGKSYSGQQQLVRRTSI